MKLGRTLLTRLFLIVLATTSASAQTTPAYDPGGNLLLPAGYETWVFVGSNLGLAYNSDVSAMTVREGARADDQLFHNIYIDPAAYAAFTRTGEFPDPTILIMELYGAEAKDPGGVLNGGLFNGNRTMVEAAVKDTHRPTRPGSMESWAYYAFPLDAGGQPASAARAFDDADCHACHKLHAGHDNVWVQFYPQLRGWLEK